MTLTCVCVCFLERIEKLQEDISRGRQESRWDYLRGAGALAEPKGTDELKIMGGFEQFTSNMIMKSQRDALGVVGERRGLVGPSEKSSMGSQRLRVKLGGEFGKEGTGSRRGCPRDLMDEEGDHMAIGNGDGVFPAASGAKAEGGAVKVGEGFGEGCERRGDGCGRDAVGQGVGGAHLGVEEAVAVTRGGAEGDPIRGLGRGVGGTLVVLGHAPTHASP